MLRAVVVTVRSGAQAAGRERPVLEDQVAVDLVGQDDQVELAGGLAQVLDGGLGGQASGRVVRQRGDDDPRVESGPAGFGDRPAQPVGLGDAALAGRGAHAQGLASDQFRLGRVGHPGRAGDDRVPADRAEDREQQRLGAGAEQHLVFGRGQFAAGPVSGDGLAGRADAGHRAVGGLRGGLSQSLREPRVHRDSGLPEGECEHLLPGGAAGGDGLAGGEGG
ncbi:hypothetical protein GCM10029992_62150 [Glycomyces albus]